MCLKTVARFDLHFLTNGYDSTLAESKYLKREIRSLHGTKFQYVSKLDEKNSIQGESIQRNHSKFQNIPLK